MPLRWFDCEAGRVEVAQCLEECPLGRRCLTKPTLLEISREREWTGKASVTQLINGTMNAYLKLTKDYAITPDSRAFALLGTRHHKQLEDAAIQLGLPTEIKLDGDTTGILDLLEIENNEIILSDLKTFGSFKVAKCLGLESVGKKQWRCNPDLVDMVDIELQLNKYRVELEKQFGLHVDRMQVQITVRDGGLWSSKNIGVDKNFYLLPVARLNDADVERYFNKKAKDLETALAHGWTERCEYVTEAWNGRRCSGFCEVAEHCEKW